MKSLSEILEQITGPDEAAGAACRARWDGLAKPLGSLGLLDGQAHPGNQFPQFHASASLNFESGRRPALWVSRIFAEEHPIGTPLPQFDALPLREPRRHTDPAQ